MLRDAGFQPAKAGGSIKPRATRSKRGVAHRKDVFQPVKRATAAGWVTAATRQ